MADTDVTIKDAAQVDRKVDTRTVGAGTDEHRQVIVLGDPTTAASLTSVINDAALVAGDEAHDAVDAGQPIKIGGRASNAPPTAVADGDRVNAAFTREGGQMVTFGPNNTAGDAQPASSVQQPRNFAGTSGNLGVVPFVFNGTTWDRLRGDTLGVHISRPATAATATLSNVAASASSVQLLALNTARKGATVFNDSSANLFLKLGTTASTTSFTHKLAAGVYYEIPFGYTGRIDGIWDSATGDARVTELT